MRAIADTIKKRSPFSKLKIMRCDENGIPQPTLQEQITHYFGWLDLINPSSAPHNPETQLQRYLRSLPPLKEDSTLAEQLAQQRERLRKEKRWSEADDLRQQIESMGYRLIDGKDGFTLIQDQ